MKPNNWVHSEYIDDLIVSSYLLVRSSIIILTVFHYVLGKKKLRNKGMNEQTDLRISHCPLVIRNTSVPFFKKHNPTNAKQLLDLTKWNWFIIRDIIPSPAKQIFCEHVLPFGRTKKNREEKLRKLIFGNVLFWVVKRNKNLNSCSSVCNNILIQVFGMMIFQKETHIFCGFLRTTCWTWVRN